MQNIKQTDKAVRHRAHQQDAKPEAGAHNYQPKGQDNQDLVGISHSFQGSWFKFIREWYRLQFTKTRITRPDLSVPIWLASLLQVRLQDSNRIKYRLYQVITLRATAFRAAEESSSKTSKTRYALHFTYDYYTFILVSISNHAQPSRQGLWIKFEVQLERRGEAYPGWRAETCQLPKGPQRSDRLSRPVIQVIRKTW